MADPRFRLAGFLTATLTRLGWTEPFSAENVLRYTMIGRVCRAKKLLLYLACLGALVLLLQHWQQRHYKFYHGFVNLLSPTDFRPREDRPNVAHDLPSRSGNMSKEDKDVFVKEDNLNGESEMTWEGLKNQSKKFLEKFGSTNHSASSFEVANLNRSSKSRPSQAKQTPDDKATDTNNLQAHEAPPPNDEKLYLVFDEKESPFSRVRWPHGLNMSSTVTKIIEWYNPPTWWRRYSDKTIFGSCPVSCSQHFDGKLLKQADAVLFHGRDIVSPEPPARKPGQIWVWFTVEAPANHHRHHHKSPKWVGAFNWTMMYRRDSDIWLPYGFLRRVANPKPRNFTHILQNKSRSVSWLVSNMHAESRRHEYVALLKKFVPVDMFGRCKGLCTPWKANNPEWYDLVTKTYRFYLSFENNHCRDYVTEKFFKTFASEVIPVVRGGPWLQYDKFFPKDTYVDTSNFKTVKALAEHLKHLERHPEEYVDILRKRSHYVIGDNVELSKSAMCQLCIRLHNVDKFQKTYANIHKWMVDGVCDYNVRDLVLT